MKVLTTFFIMFLGILCLFSCKRSTGAIAIENNDYRLFNLQQAGWKSKPVTQYLSPLSYTATEVPIQYYILKNGAVEDVSKLDSIYNQHKTERIIEMEFAHDAKEDLLQGTFTRRDYQSSVSYMAFNIKEDFTAITVSGDTIPCLGVTFERNFKLAPFKRILLHFGNIPEEENIQLVYHDQLFGNGILKFKFKETPLPL